MKSKYLVVSKGLSYVRECSCEKEIKKVVKQLNNIGYKKPIIYKRVKGV